MSPVLLLLISAVASLVGIFSNTRMLIFGCFNIKANHSTLRKLRPFVVCQFIYQVTILVITTIGAAWRGLGYVELVESYMYVFNTLVNSMLIILTFNVMAIFVIISLPDNPEPEKPRQFLLKLLMPATLLLGVTVSAAMMWYGHEFGLRGILIAILLVLLLLTIFAQFSDLSTYAQLEEIKEPLESTSLCNTIKENKELLLLVALTMLSCGGMIAFVSPPSVFNEILSKENASFLHVLMGYSTSGWIMPFGLYNLILEFKTGEERNEMKEVGIRVWGAWFSENSFIFSETFG